MSTTSNARPAKGLSQPHNGLELKDVLTAEVFRRMISLERKRSERTQRPFVLLLMDTGRTQPTAKEWSNPARHSLRAAERHARNRRHGLV